MSQRKFNGATGSSITCAPLTTNYEVESTAFVPRDPAVLDRFRRPQAVSETVFRRKQRKRLQIITRMRTTGEAVSVSYVS